MWALLVFGGRRVMPSAYRAILSALALIWFFCLFIGKTPFHIDHEAILLVGGASFAVLWLILPFWLPATHTVATLHLLPAAAILYGMTFLWHADNTGSGEASLAGLVVVALAFLGALVATLIAPTDDLPLDRRSTLFVRGGLVTFLLLTLATLARSVPLLHVVAFASNVLFATFAIFLTWHGAKIGRRRYVNLGITCLVLLLITRFIDILGNMLRSGVGMIMAGVMLGVLGYLIERARKRIIAASERSAP
jgi:hypothetical protein